MGYVVLEIPGSILVEKWTAKGWIARIMISWGILAMLTGFVHTKNQLYIVRFLLGAAEAGILPRNYCLHQPLVSLSRSSEGSCLFDGGCLCVETSSALRFQVF